MTETRATMSDFVKSEDAGYEPGKLLRNLGGKNRHVSVYKHKQRWIAAIVVDGVATSNQNFGSQQEAMDYAVGLSRPTKND